MRLAPQQMMLKAIYKTVESVEVFPEVSVETVNEKLYLLSSLLDLGHLLNLKLIVDSATINRLVKKSKQPNQNVCQYEGFQDFLRNNNRNFSIRSEMGTKNF